MSCRRALGAFHRANPQVKLTLDVVNRFTAQERLLNDEVDLAVMGLIEDAARSGGGAVRAQRAGGDRLAATSACRSAPDSRWRSWQARRSCLREEGSGTRTDVERDLQRRGIEVSVMMELRSSGAIKQAVAAELGIAVMPLGAMELELLAQRVAVLDVDGFPVMRSWSLARRTGRRLSAAAEALWRFLLEYRSEVVCEIPPTGATRPIPSTTPASS